MALHLGQLPGVGYVNAFDTRAVDRLDGHRRASEMVAVAEEVPVALVYNGRSHVVVMATPTDLEDLAVGFSYSEGIVGGVCEMSRIEVVRHSRGVEVQIAIPAERATRLDDRRRSMSARTGCGLCGVEALDDVLRLPEPLSNSQLFTAEALWEAGSMLDRQQPINRETRAVHAAAWCTADGAPRVVCEDVGRHNALDKVIGSLLRTGTDPSDGFLMVTSRASYELVLQAATARVALLAAVSRPTGLAIRIADALGLTLVGLLRGESANVYSHPTRIQRETS